MAKITITKGRALAGSIAWLEDIIEIGYLNGYTELDALKQDLKVYKEAANR